jgi:hypothetical protein
LGVFEEIPVKTFFRQRRRCSDYPWEQADASIDQGHGPKLTAGHDKIAQANLLEGSCLDNSLVHTLEPSA